FILLNLPRALVSEITFGFGIRCGEAESVVNAAHTAKSRIKVFFMGKRIEMFNNKTDEINLGNTRSHQHSKKSLN
ncbi:MAG: hypothetical protein ACRC3B_22430, partial [Bacteroidia bacterium]